MTVGSRLAHRPSVPLGLLGVVIGVALGGVEAAVLGGVIGFFLGKSLRSVARTFGAGPG